VFEKIGVSGIPTSAIYLVLNIGLYILAFKTLGKKFAIKALLGIVSFSLGMEIFNLIEFNLKYELLISAIFGGSIMGIGVGFVVRFGGSTGGTDMIASIIKTKRKISSFGSIIIIVDMTIIALTLFVFTNGLELLPYTIIALLLCMFTTDYINDGYKAVRAFNIITTKPEELSEAIMHQLVRGCSCTAIKGMYTHSDRYIVLCLISKYQTAQMRTIIRSIDPEAFVYSTKISEVSGSWRSTASEQNEEK
jgi:uncharacterized membrane-anchored protein YitT (DUF2179 family)